MKNKSTIIQVAALITILFVAVAYPVTLEQVNTTSPQTLTNKTLTAPTISTPTITDPTITSPTIDGIPTITGVLQGASPLIFEGATDDAFETTITIEDPTADRIHTVPDVASDTFGMVAASQTLTNKTLDDPILTRDAEASLPASSTEGKIVWLDDGPQGLIGDFGSKLAHLFGYNWIADRYTDCNEAITAIGATQATLVVQKDCAISATVSAPTTLSWQFEGQGKISPTTTQVLTVNGPWVAPLRKVINCVGSEDCVVFGSGSIKEVFPQWWGGATSEADNDTFIQAAINSLSGGIVTLTDGTWLSDTISMKPNIHLRGTSLASIWKLKDSASGVGGLYGILILSADATENVKISNMTIDGNRANQAPVGGGNYFNIYVNNGDSQDGNIFIDSVRLINAASDTIRVNSGATKGPTVISNFYIDNARQNGLAVIQGQNVFIRDGKIANTTGVEPGHGIDIEVNNGSLVKNIFIDNVVTFNNAGSGLGIGNAFTQSWQENIQVTNYTSYKDLKHGIHINMPGYAYSINGAQIINPQQRGIWLQGAQEVDLRNITIMNPSQSGSTYEGIRSDTASGTNIKNITMDNITIRDNTGTALLTHGVELTTSDGGVNIGKIDVIIDDTTWSGQKIRSAGRASIETRTDTITLTAAQVNLLQSVPIELVPTPGPQGVIEFVSALLFYNYDTTAFTVDADEDFVIGYESATDVTASIETTGFIDQTSDEGRMILPTWNAGNDLTTNINQNLEIQNTGAGEIADGGSSTLIIHITYRVHRTGLS